MDVCRVEFMRVPGEESRTTAVRDSVARWKCAGCAAAVKDWGDPNRPAVGLVITPRPGTNHIVAFCGCRVLAAGPCRSRDELVHTRAGHGAAGAGSRSTRHSKSNRPLTRVISRAYAFHVELEVSRRMRQPHSLERGGTTQWRFDNDVRP